MSEICNLTKVDQKEVSNLKMYHCNYLLLPHLHLLREAKTECPLILFMEMITVNDTYLVNWSFQILISVGIKIQLALLCPSPAR